MKYRRLMGLGASVFAIAPLTASLPAPTAAVTPQLPDETTKVKALEAFGKLPLNFEVNQGQIDKSVNFLARGSGYSVFLTPTQAVLSMQATRNQPSTVSPSPRAELKSATKTDTTVLRLQLVNANPTAPVKGLEQLSSKSNYLIGNNRNQWHTDIAHYGKVQYQGVYPGVDLVYYGNQKQLEYDFIVAPGANPNNIQFQVTGAKRLEIDQQGNLVLHTDSGVIRQHRPVVYQQINGKKREIAGKYVLLGQQKVGFVVASYDTSLPLVIDPVISYSTYLGGKFYERGNAIAIDSAGYVYVTGYTESSDFPVKNAFTSTYISPDVFVTKLNPSVSGSASLIYSTYFGGTGSDYGYGIAVDSNGSAYVTGFTGSHNFPTKNGYNSNTYPPGASIFVTKLNPVGNALIYSTYLGGGGSGNAIAVDKVGNAYITGFNDITGTGSNNQFPTKNAYASKKNGGSDVILTKINPALSGAASILYSTYLGGSGEDIGYGIAVDSNGNAYVTGHTQSTNFPTKNAFDSTLGANQRYDAFVAKINTTASGASSLVYSSYLGGSGTDEGRGIAVDRDGNAYVTGNTESSDFPVKNAYTSFGGGVDPFMTKVNATGNAILYSTFMGGSAKDYGTAIAVDSAGYVYVTGYTYSINFPVKQAFTSKPQGGWDGFVAKLNPATSGAPSLVYSSYLGGSASDYGYGIAVDSKGNAYVTGYTGSGGQSVSISFPTKNAFNSTCGCNPGDAFVTKIAP